MVADGYTCTLRPILAPKQRSRNRLQPKQGLGLNRKSGCANVHSTRRIISLDEYFLARRFCSTSSMLIPDIGSQMSDNSVIKNDCDFFNIRPSIRPISAHLAV